jgi:hypothetical protein
VQVPFGAILKRARLRQGCVTTSEATDWSHRSSVQFAFGRPGVGAFIKEQRKVLSSSALSHLLVPYLYITVDAIYWHE